MCTRLVLSTLMRILILCPGTLQVVVLLTSRLRTIKARIVVSFLTAGELCGKEESSWWDVVWLWTVYWVVWLWTVYYG